ncbi:hypothetical protein L7F22_047974 [Adiantum nelumboides]|nr:hypothetical protein [Adiantum nelumboides]
MEEGELRFKLGKKEMGKGEKRELPCSNGLIPHGKEQGESEGQFIFGLVNKVNASNVKFIILELFAKDLIWGRGPFARSCMKSQMASPLFTHVFVALVVVVNMRFLEVGKLLLKRVLLQFRRALKQNDKPQLLAAVRFITHLVTQQVAHEIVAFEVLMVLLENPTDDSIEVSVRFVTECGAMVQDLAPQGLHGTFKRLWGEKSISVSNSWFAIRKARFEGHPAVLPELDLMEQEDQGTHEISLLEDLNAETSLDILNADLSFVKYENNYEDIKKDILAESSSDDDKGECGQSSDSDEDDEVDKEDRIYLVNRDLLCYDLL